MGRQPDTETLPAELKIWPASCNAWAPPNAPSPLLASGLHLLDGHMAIGQYSLLLLCSLLQPVSLVALFPLLDVEALPFKWASMELRKGWPLLPGMDSKSCWQVVHWWQPHPVPFLPDHTPGTGRSGDDSVALARNQLSPSLESAQCRVSRRHSFLLPP